MVEIFELRKMKKWYLAVFLNASISLCFSSFLRLTVINLDWLLLICFFLVAQIVPFLP